jgi:hypothetical protein
MTRPSSTPTLVLSVLDDADQESLLGGGGCSGGSWGGGWGGGWGGCMPPISKPEVCARPVLPQAPTAPNCHGGGSHLLGLLHLAALLRPC